MHGSADVVSGLWLGLALGLGLGVGLGEGQTNKLLFTCGWHITAEFNQPFFRPYNSWPYLLFAW